jgi:hypothetical protein
VPPIINIYHPKTPLKSTPLSVFFRDLSFELIAIVELMYVYLCTRKAEQFSGFPVTVFEFPSDKRKHENIRFGYGVSFGNDFVPFG